ncbi:MAG: lysophospholipid acyltransferase family protein [Microthrixaceae bacterium]
MKTLLSKIWLFLWRWKVTQSEPIPDRCVMIAAPHTSNWDFPITLSMAGVSGIDIRWLGKAQMFNPVLGPVFRALGGISVQRSSSNGLVGDLAEEFSRHDRLVLVVPAEGTRSAVEHWKSGFYQIASQAGVPIVCAYVDRSTRRGGFGPVITPSGDVRADMDRIRAFYAGKTGLKPNRFSTPRLREEDAARAGGD